MSVNLEIKEEELSVLNDINMKYFLWDECSKLFISCRNNNSNSILKLEEISRSNEKDIICIGYLILLLKKM